MDDRAEVTKLQKGHGEWNEDMIDVRSIPMLHDYNYSIPYRPPSQYYAVYITEMNLQISH